MGEIRTANDYGTRAQFVQVHKLYQNREEKSSGPRCFSMMEKSLGPAHYSGQFHNRDLAQWSSTSEVSARDRQLDSVAVAMNRQTRAMTTGHAKCQEKYAKCRFMRAISTLSGILVFAPSAIFIRRALHC